jgi:hypothetical protein
LHTFSNQICIPHQPSDELECVSHQLFETLPKAACSNMQHSNKPASD